MVTQSKKRRIKDTCKRNGWAGQGREREKKEEGRIDGEISSRNYSIEAAQLELQRHTSEKGKHAAALEIREEGEEDITSLKLQIKVGGFAHFPDFHLSWAPQLQRKARLPFFILLKESEEKISLPSIHNHRSILGSDSPSSLNVPEILSPKCVIIGFSM